VPFRDFIRVEVFLPANDPVERAVVNRILQMMLDVFGGATASVADAPVYFGYYRTPSGWVEDGIVRIVSDTAESQPSLESTISSLHDAVALIYREASRTQEELWITVTPVRVYSSTG
jgi:hypothetical protein